MNRLHLVLGAIAALALLPAASCHYNPPPNPGGSGGTPGQGGAASIGGSSSAGQAGAAGAPSRAELTCQHLLELGCPEVRSVQSCAEQIATIQSLGATASIDLDCLLAAPSVASVRACQSVPCGGVK